MRFFTIAALLIILFIPLSGATIIVGIDKNYPPNEYLVDGKATGYNVDIMNAIAKEMNENVTYIAMEWSDAVSALKNGEVDILFMVKTEEREKSFIFSKPVIDVKLSIFVKKNVYYIHSIEDLNGHTVAVEKGDIGEEILKKEVKNAILIETDDPEKAIKLLENGEAKAYFGNYHVGCFYVNKHSYTDIKITGEKIKVGERAIAAMPWNKKLIERINESLDKIKENGVYDRITKKWFGEEIYHEKIPSWAINAAIIFIFSAIASLSLLTLWNRSLSKKVKERTRELEEYKEHLEEMVKEKTEEIKTLSYSLAHDLKAPIRGIKTFSSILMNDKLSQEDERDMIERINKSAQWMEELMNSLMEYGSIERLEPEMKKVDMNEIIREVLNELEHEIEKRNASINVDELPSVKGDEKMLKRVMFNLVSNSIKFVEEGKDPVVKIYAKDMGKRVRIYVKDNGIGIDKKDRKRIFLPFGKLHGREEYEGTGLGLAMVKRAVEKMNGRVGLINRKEGGSIFWIELEK